MACEAYAQAELFFRRAIWLNPYEPHFRVHLAHSLIEQENCAEAAQILRSVLSDAPEFPPALTLLQSCERRLQSVRNPIP